MDMHTHAYTHTYDEVCPTLIKRGMLLPAALLIHLHVTRLMFQLYMATYMYVGKCIMRNTF